jgi:hypothetical protein
MNCLRCNGTKTVKHSNFDGPLFGASLMEEEIVFYDNPCPNCYGLGVIDGDEYEKMDKQDTEIMNAEIKRINDSNLDDVQRQILIQTCKLLHGKWELPKKAES